VYTVPKWDDVVAAKVRSVGGSWTVILIALGGLTISALTHGLAYYKLLRNSGAVTTGVLQYGLVESSAEVGSDCPAS